MMKILLIAKTILAYSPMTTISLWLPLPLLYLHSNQVASNLVSNALTTYKSNDLKELIRP